MPRVPVVVALLVAVMPLLLTPVAFAQEATPTGQAGGTPEAVRGRPLAAGAIEVLAPGTGNIALGRIVLEPGTSLLFDPTDPSAVLLYMGAGELTFRVETEMTVARNRARGTPVPTEPEAVEANTAFTMSEGDSALFPPAIAGEIRNDGAEAATAWVVGVTLQPTEAAATPTP